MALNDAIVEGDMHEFEEIANEIVNETSED